MKRVGLIGGATWHSTSLYYNWINSQVATQLGNHASAEVVLWNLNFQHFVELQRKNDWKAIDLLLCDAALKLQEIGCEALMGNK